MRNYSIEQRASKLAHYIVDSKDTVRGAAKKFGISKSTVHTEESELQKYKLVGNSLIQCSIVANR